MDISMSVFVDFSVLTGSPRVTKVRQIKKRPVDYDPATDFWGPLRKAITAYHRPGRTDGYSIRQLLPTISDKKHARYDVAIRGYEKFLKQRKGPKSSAAKRERWVSGDLTVRINPEVGLVVGGVPHILKLHFRADPPLTLGRAQAMIALMEEHLRPHVAEEAVFGVVDVPKSKLALAHGSASLADVYLGLQGDALAFVDIWNRV